MKEGDDTIGNETRVKVVKNKVAPPFRQAEFQILYNRGVNREAEVIDLAVKEGLVEKSGAWYSHNGNKIGQGKTNACNYLVENPDVYQQIEGQLKERLLQVKKASPAPDAPDAPEDMVPTAESVGEVH